MASTEKIMNKVNEILEEEGVDVSSKTTEELLNEFILPGLNNSKDTLSAIYYTSRTRQGFVGKLKTKLQSKIIYTVINVVEKQSMKQQKFNGLVVKAIEALAQENKDLKEEIRKISKS